MLQALRCRLFLDYAGAIRLRAGEFITIYQLRVSGGLLPQAIERVTELAVAQRRTQMGLTPVVVEQSGWSWHQRRGDAATTDFCAVAE